MPVEFKSRFLRPCSATVVLVGKRVGSPCGSTLVFTLETCIDNIIPFVRMSIKYIVVIETQFIQNALRYCFHSISFQATTKILLFDVRCLCFFIGCYLSCCVCLVLFKIVVCCLVAYLFYVMLCCVVLCYVMLCYVMCYTYVVLCCVVLCCVMLCCVMLYCVFYVMLCYVMLCYVMLWCVMLCCVVLCCFIMLLLLPVVCVFRLSHSILLSLFLPKKSIKEPLVDSGLVPKLIIVPS